MGCYSESMEELEMFLKRFNIPSGNLLGVAETTPQRAASGESPTCDYNWDKWRQINIAGSSTELGRHLQRSG